MTNQSEDRRVQRTRQLLHRALIDLIIEKGYERVTIQDITDRANLGRTTFYAHYQDKEDLLFHGLADYLNALVKELERQMSAANADFLPVAAIFHHVADNLALFQAFGSIEFLMEKFHQEIVSLIKKRLAAMEWDEAKSAIPSEVLVNYLAGALLAILKWWRDTRTPQTPEAMAAMFQRLAVATIDGAAK